MWRPSSRRFPLLPVGALALLAGTVAAWRRRGGTLVPAPAVHPTVGSFQAPHSDPSPDDYATMLDQAGTAGFAVYPAETEMPDTAWAAYGNAIARLGIARAPAS